MAVNYTGIPANLIDTFFPSLNSSINDLLAFDLLAVADVHRDKPLLFASKYVPDTEISNHVLRDIPPPASYSLKILEECIKKYHPKSISYSNCESGSRYYLPLRVLSVWRLLAQVHTERNVWATARAWIKSKSYVSMQHNIMGGKILAMLSQVSWGGWLGGLSGTQPMRVLTDWASR